ncbi:hypothetical protein B0I35DRAFT_354453 [Stachybotrys elegans]|uniref:Zn(2)-C6 fungal-type domain-containing protein n=1 Tax=Stachybotrys elegans TaxID=80388 RepID=A0A8K0SN66_9HYPO|nr:hypothetical protein B0I35DRAFT_354453 [Stachybotrys elegans]
MSSPARAQQACSFCRRQKRKCDKLIPRCTTCRRVRRDCEYTLDRQDELDVLRTRVQQLERALHEEPATSIPQLPRLAPEDSDTSRARPGDGQAEGPQSSGWTAPFPSAFFLDVARFRRLRASLPQPTATVSERVSLELGSTEDIRHIIDTYFTTVHRWLPIVWRRKVERQAHVHDGQLPHDTALLLACMKLVSDAPAAGRHPSQSRLYDMVRNELTLLENQGLMSASLLQVAVLVATYELGHGIYPAAYLSVGHCIRVGHMMGLHDRRRAPQAVVTFPSYWAENEELTRLWCAIVVLDRYINLGSKQRPLMSGDFADDEMLPCNTSDWDAGEPSANIPLFAASASQIAADPFARTCQVAHLLGRVISHRDEKEEGTANGSYRFTNAKQLLATLDSLLKVLAGESESAAASATAAPTSLELQLGSAAFGSAYAMALSAKMVLLDIYSCTCTSGRVNCAEEAEMQVITLRAYPDTVYEAARLAMRLCEVNSDSSSSSSSTAQLLLLSPFVNDCFYQGADAAAWYLNENGNEQMRDARDIFMQSLGRVKERWRVAGK